MAEEHGELATEYVDIDPKGYFVIRLDRESGEIVVEHYSNDALMNRIRGKSAKYIYKRAISLGLASDLSHAAYLGHELRNAQLALEHGLEYQQDRELSFPKKEQAIPAGQDTSASTAKEATYIKAGKLVPIADNHSDENVKVGGIEVSWREFLRSRGLSRAF